MPTSPRALFWLLATLSGPAVAQTPPPAATPATAPPAVAAPETAAPAAEAPAPPAPTPLAEPAPEADPKASEPASELRLIPGPDRVFIDRLTAGEGGLTGLDRLTTASIGPLGTLRLRAGLTHFEVLDFPVDESTNVFTATDISVSGTPLSFAEIAFGVRATSNANTASLPRVLQSVGDANFGLKLGWTLWETLSVAYTAEVMLVGLVGGGGIASDATSYRHRGILTGDFHRGFDIPARLTFALGYDVENRGALFADELQEPSVITEWGLQAYRYDRVMASLGLEVPVHAFGGVFVEYHIGTPLQVELTRRGPGSDDFIFDVVPHWVTPGIRAFPVPELAVDFALRYGLSDSVYTGVPATPPWALQIALTYTLDPRPDVVEREVVREVKPPPPTRLGGAVVDGATQAPIAGAVVDFGPGLSPQVTGADGRFSGYRLPEGGRYTLRVQAEGYQPADAAVEVADGGEVVVPFALSAAPPPPTGTLQISVADAAGEPAEALVRVYPQKTRFQRVKAGQTFDVPLPPGKYRVFASGKDAPLTETGATVDSGQTGAVEVRLAAAGEAPAAKGKKARTPKKATAKTSTTARKTARRTPKAKARSGGKGRYPSVRFRSGKATLSAKTKAALDGVAAQLKRRSGVRLRIAAYTDNQGTPAQLDRLSNDRARAVKAYLVGKGIEGRRLSARGYGSSKPVAPNLTASGRARNNRVEFRVLGGK